MAGGTKVNRREQAIAALLSGPTLDHASQACGVSVATLKRWLKEPVFRADFAEARRGILERTASRLLQATTLATLTLEKALQGGKVSDQIRAACAILDNARRGVEQLDLAEQVADLRRQVEEMHSQRPGPRPYSPRGRGGAA